MEPCTPLYVFQGRGGHRGEDRRLMRYGDGLGGAIPRATEPTAVPSWGGVRCGGQAPCLGPARPNRPPPLVARQPSVVEYAACRCVTHDCNIHHHQGLGLVQLVEQLRRILRAQREGAPTGRVWGV